MWARRITMYGAMALAAAAPGTEAVTRARGEPDCTPVGFVTQAMNGRITACLRVGNLAPGRRAVALQDLLDVPPARRRQVSKPARRRQVSKPARRRQVSKPAPAAQPWVRLTLSPASGPPGTVVTITGHLRRPPAPHDSHPNVCWDGCTGGFGYGDVMLHWRSPTAFQTRIVVPGAPWIAGAPARVVPLVTGDYPVAIMCLRETEACGPAPGPPTVFHLEVARPVAWCRTPSRCARLRVMPARAQPGEIVRVTGFAPLVQGNLPVTGTDYTTVLLRERRHAPEVRFGDEGGLPTATVGHGVVQVTPAPRYRAVSPLGQVSDAVPQIAADPADPARVAWCAGQTIGVLGPGGLTNVPTASAKPVLRALGFSFRADPQPECAAVAPIATVTGAPVGVAAAFSVTESDGPPFYLAALVTRDAGETWALIPVPRGSGPAGFGGFRYAGDGALQAVFGHSLQSPIKDFPQFEPSRPVTEASTADGQSWTQAPMPCPSEGPCVTFGLYQPGNCAMNGSEQSLLRSTNGGRRWSPLDFPYPAQACLAAELVATSSTGELLIDSASTYPVLRTTDGGATWHDVWLPRRGGDGNLTVLPDGSLLMADSPGYGGPWKLLGRGRRAWCALRVPARTPTGQFPLTPPAVIGGRLWWLTSSQTSATTPPALHVLALRALRC